MRPQDPAGAGRGFWPGSSRRVDQVDGHGAGCRDDVVAVDQRRSSWRPVQARSPAAAGPSGIAGHQAIVGLPALQRSHGDPDLRAGALEPCAVAVSRFDVLGQDDAVFEADHSPLSLLQTASSFRDSTSSAAVRQEPCPAPNLALKLLDASPVLLGLLRAGTGLLGRGQRLRGAVAPLRTLLRINAVLAAPSAARRFVHGRRRDHRFEPRRRCPGPLASRPGRRIAEPPLQRLFADPPLHAKSRAPMRSRAAATAPPLDP